MITTNPVALFWKYPVEGITTKNGQVTNWPEGLPPLTQAIIDQAEAEYAVTLQAEQDMLTGVLFEGKMCSATESDMWSLKAVEDDVKAGLVTNFVFENGTVLELRADNIAALRAVWVPFRASFF